MNLEDRVAQLEIENHYLKEASAQLLRDAIRNEQKSREANTIARQAEELDEIHRHMQSTALEMEYLLESNSHTESIRYSSFD